eukprot:GGOE01057883.1.p1 GENE.GGOE01057883.1~~GGOE01057883.1.p1  ORF type:complete len:112 (+),score=3.31 GGOE01057883.1:31-336(+)
MPAFANVSIDRRCASVAVMMTARLARRRLRSQRCCCWSRRYSTRNNTVQKTTPVNAMPHHGPSPGTSRMGTSTFIEQDVHPVGQLGLLDADACHVVVAGLG